EVGRDHDPQQQEPEPCTALHVRGEVPGVDVGDRGDEGGAEQAYPACPAPPRSWQCGGRLPHGMFDGRGRPSARAPKPGAWISPGLTKTSSTISVSVVSSSAAMEAALWMAHRVTFSGSTMPRPNMSPYSPVSASKPTPSSAATRAMTSSPS